MHTKYQRAHITKSVCIYKYYAQIAENTWHLQSQHGLLMEVNYYIDTPATYFEYYGNAK